MRQHLSLRSYTEQNRLNMRGGTIHGCSIHSIHVSALAKFHDRFVVLVDCGLCIAVIAISGPIS